MTSRQQKKLLLTLALGVGVALASWWGIKVPPSFLDSELDWDELAQTITTQASPIPTIIATPATSSAGRERAVVRRVVDGDTIELESGQKVRYIGIDTPETVDPRRPVGCYGKEASAKNQELVEGKLVELEQDVSDTDNYGRLLRYVFVEGIFVNEYLVSEGYAQMSTYPPDVKYDGMLLLAQDQAKTQAKGLWGSVCQ